MKIFCLFFCLSMSLSACLPQTPLSDSAPAIATVTNLPPATSLPSPSIPATPSPASPFPPSPTAAPPEITELPITNTPLSTLHSPTSPFPLSLPISLPLSSPIPIDPSYRFASTQSGNREPHHGIEFLVPFGSPVLAAADGTVLFAGDDNNGSPYTRPNNYAFYGNFIILEHNLQSSISNLETPFFLYTLYAHLSQIHIQTGDTIQAGDEIGLIGFTGAALGPHLHFEVRLNGTTYADSYNPELFLNQPGYGVLTGRILDANGFPIPPTALTLTYLTPLDTAQSTPTPGQPKNRYLTTYENPALALRQPFNENFALALPPGLYELAFVLYGVHKQTLEIYPGELTFFEMTVGEP